MSTKAIVVEVSGAARDLKWPLSLEEKQRIVAGDEQTGALIEYVPRVNGKTFLLPDGRMATMRDCIVNEEGLLIGLEYNIGASVFLNEGKVRGPYRITGDAIIIYEEPEEKATAENEALRAARSVEYMMGAITDAITGKPEKQFIKLLLGSEEE